MIAPTWLQKWLRARSPRTTPLDPLAQFSTLTVERLEERRVLSVAPLVYDGTVLDVDISGTDDVEISYDNGMMYVYSSDTDTTESIAFDPTIHSLRITGDANVQTVTFLDGTDPDTISLVSLTVADSVEFVKVDTVITAAMDVDINVADTLTVYSDVTSTGGSIIFEAGESIVIDVGASLDAETAVELTSLNGDISTGDITSGGNISLTATNGTVTTGGLLDAGTFVDIEGTAVTLNGGIQADGTITVDATTGDLDVHGTITGGDDVTLTAANDLTIHNGSGVSSTGEGDILLSADRTVTISEDVGTTGTGTLTVTGNSNAGARNIVVNSGAVVSTVDGNLTLDADQGTQQSGNFTGVLITGSGTQVDVTGTGALSISGRGGDAAANQQIGVEISGGAVVSGGTTGTVSVSGIGGAATSTIFNHGVYVGGSGSAITSDGADVLVTGVGGGVGFSSFNHGVYASNGSTISAGGVGNVNVHGTGGTLALTNNRGVVVDADATITSSGGDVSVTGVGGGTGNSSGNWGISVAGGTITAGGMGSVTVHGTGGTTNGTGNVGVRVVGNGVITSSGGDVLVTGVEGSGTNGYAILLAGNGTISHTNDGSITLIGNSFSIDGTSSVNAGAGTVQIQQLTNGVAIDLGAATDTVGGPLSLSDDELDRITAGTLVIGNANSGAITVSAAISPANVSTLVLNTGANVIDGTGTEQADVIVTNLIINAVSGIGATGDGDLDTQVTNFEAVTATGGIFVGNTGALTLGGLTASLNGVDVTGASGDIVITSTGTLTVNEGISGPGSISLIATGSSSDLTISVNSGVTSNGGNILLAADRTVTISEDVTTTGTGTLTVTGNYDGLVYAGARNIVVNNGAVVSTVDGDLSLDADQGTQIGETFVGVSITGAGTAIQVTGTGNLSIAGRGGDTGAAQYGVSISGGADVIGGTTGTVTINGTGGQSAGNNNFGVHVTDAGSSVTSLGGNVSVTGQGGGTGNSSANAGVAVLTSGTISAGGMGTVTVDGTGGSTDGSENYGVGVGFSGLITSSGGNVQVTGKGDQGGTSSFSHGVYVAAGGVITAGGSGSVTVDGTGGIGTKNSNYGVHVDGAGSSITSAGGDVLITGTGGGSDSSNNNYGVYVLGSGTIGAGGSGSLTITGAGGSTTGTQNYGVFLSGAGSNISSAGGDVSITGLEGSGPSGTAVLMAASTSVTSGGTGEITITADSLSIANTASINAGTGTVTLWQYTDDLQINLGGADAAGVLGLTDDELDRITADTLIIGNANSGNITISAAISPANVSTLELVTGAAIVDGNAGGADITVDQLVLVAATGIGAGDALELDVNVLAFRNTTSGEVEIVNDGFLTIGTLGSLTGLMGAELGNFGGGATSVTATSPLTIAADLTSVGSMTLTAEETDDAPDFEDVLTIEAGVTVSVTGSGETLTLQAGDDVVIAGNVLVANGSVLIAAGFGDLDAAGAIQLTGTVTADDLVSLSAVTGMVGSAAVITADALEITGSGDFDLSGDNNVNTLAADLQGALTYHDVDGFVVGTAGVTTGVTLTETGAALTLSTDTGTIGLAADVTTDGDQNYQSDVTLLADITLNANSGNIAFAAGIEGTFALYIASANDVTFTGDVGTVDELALLDIIASGTVSILGNMQLGEDGPHSGSLNVFADKFVLKGSIDTQDAAVSSGNIFLFANTIELEGSMATADGSVFLLGSVLLTDDLVIGSGAGSVIFLDSLTGEAGDETLDVTSSAGGVILLNSVTSIGGLSLSSTAGAGTVVLSDDVAVNGDVTIAAENLLVSGSITTTDQYGNGDVSLTSSLQTTLADDIDAAGNIELAGNTRLDASITLTAGGDVTITGALDSNDPGSPPVDGLTINAIGDVFIMADLGTGITPGSHADGLAFLNVSASGDLYACGTWVIDTSVTFAPSVYLCDDLDITANGDVTFQSTVDSDGIAASTNLTIDAEDVDFQAAVGGTEALTGLSISASGDVTAGDGLTVVNNLSITTAGSLGIAVVGNIDSASGAISLFANDAGSILVQGNVTAETNVTMRTNQGLAGGGTISVEGSVEAATGNVLVVADEDVVIDAAIEADGFVQVVSNSGSVDIGGAVTSHNGLVSLSANDLAAANVDVTLHVGGPISAAGNVSLFALSDGANTGEIWIEGSVTTTSGSVSILAVNGAVQVDGDVSTTGTSVGIDGASIDVGGIVSAQTFVSLFAFNGDILVAGGVDATTGSVTVNAQQAGSIDITGDVTAGTDVTLTTLTGTGGGTIDVGGLVSAGSGFASIQADEDVTLGSTVDASGNITVASRSGSIDVGGAVTSSGGSVTLTANSTNAVDTDVLLHVDGDVVASTGVTITANASGNGTGDIWIEGNLSVTSSGGISMTGTNGTVDIDGNVTTMTAAAGTTIVIAGASVDVFGDIDARTSVTISGTNGNVFIAGFINAETDFVSVNAQNAGSIDIMGDVTAATSILLSTLPGTGGGTIEVFGTIDAGNSYVTVLADDAITLWGSVDANGSVTVTSQSGSVEMFDAVTSATGSVTLTANATNAASVDVSLVVYGLISAATDVTLVANASGVGTGDIRVNDSITALTGAVAVTGINGDVEVLGDVTAGGTTASISGATVLVVGAVVAESNITLTATNGLLEIVGVIDSDTGAFTASGTSIDLGDAVTAALAIQITSTNGDVLVIGDIESENANVAITAGGAGDLTTLGSILAETDIDLTTVAGMGGGSIEVGGPIISTSGSITLHADDDIIAYWNLSAENDISATTNSGTMTYFDTLDANLGSISLNNADVLLLLGAVTAGTTFEQNGGPVDLCANITADDGIDFEGDVTLTMDVTLTTVGGNVTFQSTVETDGLDAWDLTINSTTGNVEFQDTVGTTVGEELGAVDITTGGNVSLTDRFVTVDDITISAVEVLIDDVDTSGASGALGNLTITHTGDLQLRNVELAGNFLESGGGTTFFDGRVITTDGNVTFSGQVQIHDGEIETDTGNVTFQNTVDGGTSGGLTLTISSNTGDIEFQSAVGSTTKLSTLTSDTDGSTSFDSTLELSADLLVNQNASTPGDVTFSDAVDVGGAATITGSAVDGTSFTATGAISVTAGAGGLEFTGTVESTDASIDLVSSAVMNAIHIGGDVLAATTVTINSTAGNVDLDGVVTATSGSIDIDAATDIDLVGTLTAGTTVDIDAGTSIALHADLLAGDAITVTATSGGIDITGNVTSENSSILLESLAGVNEIHVGGDVEAETNVTINSVAGNVDLDGTVTAVMGAIDINAGTDIDLMGTLTAGTTVDIDAGTSIALHADLLAGDAITVTATSGGIDITGNVTSENSSILLESLGGVNEIHVGGDVEAETDVTINSVAGNVDLDGTVTAVMGAVDINAGTDIDVVGTLTAGTTVDIDAGTSIALHADLLAGDAITVTATSGGIDITGNVTSENSSILLESLAGVNEIHVGGDVEAETDVTINSVAGNVDLDGTVTAVMGAIDINAGTDIDLMGTLTAGTTVDIDAGTSIALHADLLAGDAITVTATSGGIDITGNVTSENSSILLESLAGVNEIHVGGDVEAETNVTINSVAGNVDLDGTVTAVMGAVDINAGTDIDLMGTLTAGTTVDIDAGTSATLHADLLAEDAITVIATNGAIDITGNVTSNAGPIKLESLAGAALVHVGGNLLAATSITINNLTGAVDLDGTVTATSGEIDIAADTLSAAQAITAGGNVSFVTTNGTTLADMADVTAGGTIDITGDLLTAANLQTTTGAITIDGNVTLTGNVRFDSDDDVAPVGTGNITVTGTIDLASFTLTIDAGTGGDVDLQDTVSGTGDLIIEEGNNQTYATISVNDFRIEDATTSVVLNGPVTATAVGLDLGDIFICSRGTLNIESTLTADGTVTLKADGGMKLDDNLNVGNIEFQSAVLLCTDITITATGNVTFGSTVDSAANQQYSLVVNAAGLTDFQGTVGGGTNQQLGSLTTDAAGQTFIGANVTTAFDQIYLDAVTLTADVTLTGTDNNATGEAIEFHNTLDGDGFDLTVVGGGAFAAAVTDLGDFVADRIDTESTFAAASIDVSGTADLGGNVSTTGTQQYGDAVLLTADVVVSSTGVGAAGNITFASTIDGAFDLTITSAGTTRFEGIVGGGTVLTRLTTNGGGTTVIDTTAVTAGDIVFEDDVVLAQSTTVTGTNSLEFAGALSGLSGSESLLAISGGTATFAAISNLTDVTIDTAGITTLQGNISITGTLSTIGGNVTKIDTASIEAGIVQFADAVELCQDLSISAATITFDSTLDEAVGAAGSRLTLEITNPDVASGDLTFADAVGSLRALESLLIVTANDVTFASTIRIDGDLIQQDGTGTTEFRGTSGTGIGGELQINTNIVDFYDLTIVAVGAVVITAQNGITFHANSGLNAGSSTITLRANQDQNGTQGFTQASGTIIQTTNNTSSALVIEVGGDGSAAISDLRADTASGVVTMTVGGSITDNSALETANITAAGVALAAATGIGGTGDADIDTQVANLEAQTTTGGIVIQEADDVTIGGVTVELGGVDVLTSGDISIATINGSITVSEQVSGPDNISLEALGITSDLTILQNSGVVSVNDHILLSADRTVTISEDVATSGAGTITVTGNTGAGARNIVVNSGAVVTVVNGDLLLDADRGTQQTGNFHGISIDNATLQTTGTGDVTLQGRGGNHASGSQTGVSISNGGVVQSTSTLATAGTISISGTGGESTGNNNAGIHISGSTSTVQSVNGDITLTGTGGGTGTSAGNAGIIVSGSVLSTGTTTDAAVILMTGQGGLTTGDGNLGIDINGANALVTSVRGAIALDGTGGGTNASGNNVGVRIAGGGDVTSTGTAAAGVTIRGQGGTSTGGGNAGVLVSGTGTTVSAVTGTLEIEGVGGGVGANGANHGLVIENAALVASTGAGVGAATVLLDGTGSASTGDANRGVVVDAATVATVNGALSIVGQGGGAGASGQNHGVLARNAAVITSSGLGDIAITGSGGTGTGGQNHGVVLNQADVASNGNSVSAPGDIAITATVGTGPDSLALLMSNGGSISANDPLFPGGATVTLTTLSGDVREESGFVVLSDNLLLLGPGSFTLNENNNVGTLAADVGGFLAFKDVNGLTVGTVKSTSGLTTSDDDVKLTVLAGGLTIGDNVGVAGADDITLGTGNLTLNVNGDVTQTADNVITASGLQLLGTGTVTLNEAGNNVTTLAANYNGTISYTDANALVVGTVTDTPSGMTTSGITTSDDDVKLTVLAGGLTIGDNVGVAGADDITLGTGNLTLNVNGDVTQTADNVITASGLQLLGTGTVTLNEAGNNVTTLAANYNGTISYTDANALVVGTVTDTPSGMTTSGITTSHDDVKLTVLAGGLTIGDNVGVAGADDITLGTGNLTLNVNGDVTQTADNVITASGLQLLGTGTVTLNEAGNNVTTLAANYNGTIAYTDANALVVGTVTDTPSGMTTSGITTSHDDVKLTVLAGGLTIGDNVGVAGADDITLGTGNLTLNVNGDVTQTTDNVITASGLQLLGTGTVTLNEAGNNVTTLAANYNGTIAYTDANALVVGTVTDTPSGMTTSGITTSHDDVKLTVLAGGLTIGDNVGVAGADDITLGTGNLTLDVTGAVTQTADNVITASGLQLLGTGTVTLNESDNNVSTIAADYSGNISYVDTDALIVGTVTDQAETSMVSSTGIATNGGHVSLTAADALTVNADINTSPGAGGAITVTGGEINAQLIAGAGNITLNGGNPDLIINVDQTSATTMTLQANRDVIINAIVSTTGPAADIVVTADLDQDGVGGVQVTQMGQLAAADDLTLTGSDLFATPQSSDSIRIDADGANDQLLAGGQILLQHHAVAPATADIVINGRIRSTGGDIIINAADEIHAASAIRAEGATGSITFEDAAVLTGHLDVTSGGNTTFAGTVSTADFDLTVDGGPNGDVTFEQAVTGGGHLTIANGDDIRFDGVVQVDNLSVLAASSSVTFVSAVTVQQDVNVVSAGSITQQSTLSAGNDVTYLADGAILIEDELTAVSDISLTSTLSSITATAALEATNGNLTASAGTSFSATQTLTAGHRVDVDAVTIITLAETADITAGIGGVNLSAANIITAAEITTTSGDVTLTGAVRLTGDVTIDTGAAGDFTVMGSIDATTEYAQSLFLSTGTGDILITGNIGSTTALGELVITAARDVTLGADVSASRLLQQSGTGVTTVVGNVETFGVGGIQLTTTSIQFADLTSSMDSHGNVIILTADAITLPTTFTNAIGSTVTLQTLTVGTSIGLEDASQDLNFTDVQLDTIHSANLIIGSAAQTAGIIVGTDGPVSLDENLTLLTAGTIQVTGDLSATAGNWMLLDAGDDIAVTGSVSTLSGDLTLRANDDITLGGMAHVASGSGNITLRADADHEANGSGGGITMADGAVINSGTGRLSLEADEDIVIGQLASSNGTADAITIITHSGGVVDGGDADLDIVLNNAAGVVTIQAVTGVGSATGGGADAALETQINQLQVVNSTSGDVRIDEVDALTVLGIEQFGPGDVVVHAGGTVTVAAGGPGIQSQGGDLRLTTVGATSDLVLNSALTSRGGDVVLVVGDDLIQAVSAPIDTGSGHLTINVVGDVDFSGSIDTVGGDLTATVGGNLQQGATATISTSGGDLTLDVLGDVELAAAVATSGGNLAATIGGNLTQVDTAPVSTEGGQILLDVTGNVSLAAAVSTAGGSLTVFIDGDLTQAVSAPIDTDGGDFLLDVGGNADFSGAVSTNGGDWVGVIGGDFMQSTTAPITTGGGDLDLTVGGQMSLASLINTAGGDLQFDVTGDLTQLTTAPITTEGGNVVLLVDGNLSLAALLATAGGQVLLDIGGSATIAETAPITTGGGHLTATIDQHLSLASLVETSGGNVQLTVGQSASLAATAAILTENGNFQGLIGSQFTMADGAVINTSSGTISLIAGSHITVGQLITTNATSAALLLRSTGGGIIDGGDTGGADLIANAAGSVVTIEAAQGVGSAAGFGADAAIETQINTLILRNTTTGNVRLSEVDALRILELTQTASGSVSVNAVGNLHLVGGQPGVTATSGNVTLRATGAASSVTIDSLVRTTSGQILVSAAQNVTMGAAGRILSQTGNVSVVADSDNSVNGAGGALFMANGAIINAGTGNITARADGNITVGQMLTTGTVSLTSTSAGVVDGGDAGGVDIQANALVIQTRTGIGSTNPLETSVAQLAARNTTSGAIRIENSSGNLLTIGQIGSVSGITNNGGPAAEISIINAGGITVDRDVRNTTGGNIRLTANANGGDDDHLTVNAVIAALGGNGSILLTAGNNLVLNDTGADVDMSVVNGGEILGTAGNDVLIGPDVVIQSATGVVTNTEPVLIDVLTPQVSALGVGTLTMTVQRPLEVGTVIIIDWGDGTVETFVVTEEGQTTLTFTHQYLGPPDLANPAADIPIKVTVHNPSFTTGAMASPTAGTMRVANGDYVPNIRFAANGEILSPFDIGPLNETIFNGVFKIPGDGLASFIFDLTPPVQILDFPQGSSLDASLLAVPQPPTQMNALDGLVTAAEDLQADERVVILEVLGPDGEVRERVILSEDVLDDMDSVVRQLPDGRYRFQLREPGDTQTRLLQEVLIREGKISDEFDTSSDRPRSLKTQGPGMAAPVDIPAENSLPVDALVPENQRVDADNSDENASALSSFRGSRAWRQALARAEGEFVGEVAEISDDSGESDDSTWAVGMFAAPVVGSAISGRRFGRAARLLRQYGQS